MENTAAVVGAIGRHIDAVNPDLSFEMGKAGDGVQEIILSVNGMQDLFADVAARICAIELADSPAKPAADGFRAIAEIAREADTRFAPRAA